MSNNILVNTGGYISSNGVESTTQENQELVPKAPSGWTYGYTIRKFSFYSANACTLLINGKFKISLSAGRGFEVGYNDPPISSFIIEESGTPYEFIGAY